MCAYMCRKAKTKGEVVNCHEAGAITLMNPMCVRKDASEKIQKSEDTSVDVLFCYCLYINQS